MKIIRKIYFCAAGKNFSLKIDPIPGVKNTVADALYQF